MYVQGRNSLTRLPSAVIAVVVDVVVVVVVVVVAVGVTSVIGIGGIAVGGVRRCHCIVGGGRALQAHDDGVSAVGSGHRQSPPLHRLFGVGHLVNHPQAGGRRKQTTAGKLWNTEGIRGS